MLNRFKHILLVILGVASLVGTWSYHEFVRSEQHEFEEGVALFNHVLEGAKQELEQGIDLFSKRITNQNIILPDKASLGNDYAICVLNKERLIYWTDNKFPIDQLDDLQLLSSGIHRFKNGWYYINSRVVNDDFIIVGLYQLKKAYKEENQYLKNNFNSKISLNNDWDLTNDTAHVKHACLVQNHQYSEVYLVLNGDFTHGSHLLLCSIEIVTIWLVLYGLMLFCRNRSSMYKYFSVLFLLIFRIVLLYTSLGVHYKEIELFQPELYAASDFLPSLGDLILHLLFLVTIIIISVRLRLNDLKSKVAQQLILFVSIAVVFVFGILLSYVSESLIRNSIIPLDLSDLSTLNYYSFLSYIFLGITGFGYYVLSKLILSRVSLFSSFNEIVLIIILLSAVCSLFSIGGTAMNFPLLSWIWVVPLCFLILFKLNRSAKSGFSLLHYFPEMLLFSVLFTVHMENIKSTKQSNTIAQILEREAQERDPIAEFLIFKASNKILNNITVETLDSVQVSKLLTSHYFSKYLNKFDVSWEIDSSFSNAQIDDVQTGAHSSFTKINSLLYRKMTRGSMSYLSRIPFEDKELSMLFSAKELPVNQGFPMLLASKSIEKMALGQGYSFAKYKDGQLMTNKGKYVYASRTSYFDIVEDSTSSHLVEKVSGDFIHTTLSKNGNMYVLTSDNTRYLSLIANLSYMLFFLNVILFVGGVSYRFFKEKVLFPKDFKSRLQYAILFILFFSTLVIAFGSVYFLKNQYNKENFKAISEKIRSVNLALNHELRQDDKSTLKQAELNDLSHTFFTDINIYDINGSLTQTSQANIFDAGVLSTIINPVAFKGIFRNNKAILVQIEHIEDMNYLSAYVPLYDDSNALTGCLNLPYFAKTDELQSEINGFMVALINMYLLLTVISIVIALFISNRIIKPLQFIQTKIANFNLKDKPEQIIWETDDEIGSLVKEYNRMVNELSESALRLAQAEREGAWKEMAQQVAHEIKNPLTPMKLNIQHFQMKWSGLEERERKDGFTELTRNLVEQIDTLSAIAEQFSNFATIPEPQLSTVDLLAILKSSTGIYNGSNDVVVDCDLAVKSASITADKDQLLRIFNNVIKNAIQSIPSETKGKVTVTVTKNVGGIVVTIADNGSGIEEQQKRLIFQPNFTTKTSGMGLGLAMVKKMLESINATINFDSEVGKGTSFYLKFKV